MRAYAKPRVSNCGSHLIPSTRPGGSCPNSKASLGTARSASRTVASNGKPP